LDPKSRRVPHVNGRVSEAEGEDQHSSLYVAGWVKRGPTGIIATNLADAQETAARAFVDLKQKESGSHADPAVVEAALASAGVRPVSFEGWRKIEAEELRRGAAQGKAAEKLTDVAEMLRIAAS